VSWLAENWRQFVDYGLAHVLLSVPPIVVGFVLSVPLGWLANRRRWSRGVLLTLGGILYAIPSLPLFVVLPSIIGTKILDPLNVEVALTLYAVALLLRTTADGLAAVEGQVKLSATAVGYGPWRRFLEVELPLERSSWIALRVRGADHPSLFDGPAWAHTSPVFVQVAGQKVASRDDARYFVDWIEQMLKVVAARNRYASPEDRRQVESLFRRAQDEFRKMANAN